MPWLLLVGGLAYGRGRLAGVALSGRRPSGRFWGRLLGTIVVPGGLMGVWMFVGVSGLSQPVLGSRLFEYAPVPLLILAPIGVAIYLNVVRQHAVKAARQRPSRSSLMGMVMMVVVIGRLALLDVLAPTAVPRVG